MHQVDPVLNQNISLRAKFSEETQRIISEIDSDVNAQLEFADYAFSVHYPMQAVFSALIDMDKATPSQRSRYYEMLGQYCADNPVMLSALEDDSSRQYCAASQIQSLQRRVDASVTLDKTYSYLGWLYYRQNQFDRAADTYSRWLKIKPDDADIHLRLAQMLVDQGAFGEAIGHFRAALRGDPDNFSINFRLADALARTGDLLGADTFFRKALDINSGSAETHAAYASALTALGRYDDAISHYEAALRLKPDLEQARLRLNQLLARRGSSGR
jgi:tetratricopeptide (TPR) repeat protein